MPQAKSEMDKENIGSTNKENDDTIEAQKRKNNDENQIAQRRSKRIASTTNRLPPPGSEYHENDDSLFDNILQRQTTEVVHDGDVQMADKYNETMPQPQEIAAKEVFDVRRQQITGENHVEQEQIMSPGEKILYAKILELMVEIKIIRNNVVEQLQVSAKEATQKDTNLKRLKRDQLLELGLPLENVTQMKAFESKLKNNDFYRKAVYTHDFLNFIYCSHMHLLNLRINLFQFDLLKTIGGTDGSSNGEMVLLAIFSYFIDQQLLKTISWTGKSDSKLKKKIRFESYTEMIMLINEVCITADKKYTDVQCKKDMVYKIFKYAYRIKNDQESESTTKIASTSTESNVQQNKAPSSESKQPNAASIPTVPQQHNVCLPQPAPAQPFQPSTQPPHFQSMPQEFSTNLQLSQAPVHQAPPPHPQHFQPIPHEYPQFLYKNYPPAPNGNYPPMQNGNGYYPPDMGNFSSNTQ